MMLSSSAVDRMCGYRDWKPRRSSSPLDSWSPAASDAGPGLDQPRGAASTSPRDQVGWCTRPSSRAGAAIRGAAIDAKGPGEAFRVEAAGRCVRCERRVEGWIGFGDADPSAQGAGTTAVVDSGGFMVFGDGLVCDEC